MAVYRKNYPLREFVTHRYGLRDVDAAMKKSVEAESMKVVLEPWRQERQKSRVESQFK